MMERNNVLILSPHTDDAELGCGASIIRFLREGKNILWAVFSTAEDSVPEGMAPDTIEKEFMRAASLLSLKEENLLVNHFRVRYLHEKRQEILETLVELRNKFRPGLVIGPSLNDFHQDHTVVANEMVRAFKSHASVISYELPWNHTTFSTQMFIKVEPADIDKKLKLLECYESQLAKNRGYFSEEFVRGLAKTRGIQCNSDYAEAFEVIRWIE